MAEFVKFHQFEKARSEGVHDLSSDALVLWLSDTAPSASATADLGDITEIDYTHCSSRALTVVSSSQTGGVYKLVVQDLTISASGGTVGPFRYVGVYNDTASGDPVVGGYYDHGSSVTLGNGESFVVEFNGSDGWMVSQ